MKGGYVCLGFQSINVVMNDSNQLNKFWMSCSNINQKGMHGYFDIPKWHTFIWSAKTLLKTLNNVCFWHPHLLYFFPNLWIVNLWLTKLISLSLSTHLFYEKSKILTSIPQNLVIYHTINLCHHIEYILFYLWFKYGTIWTNIVNHVESFLINYVMGHNP
jgi:hypothetical protein